jgi:hypothetical protein
MFAPVSRPTPAAEYIDRPAVFLSEIVAVAGFSPHPALSDRNPAKTRRTSK